MVKHIWIQVVGSVLFLVAGLAHADIATIVLHDGSQLRGEVVSLKQGAYTIKTASAGVLSIPQEQIKVVQYGASAPLANSVEQTPAETVGITQNMVSDMQRRLMQNPNIMATIESLKDDPQIQALVQDPAVQAAIAAGDYISLMNNPKFLALLNNPKVKGITQQVK